MIVCPGRSDDLKKHLTLPFAMLLIFLLPLRASAAGVGDVYAALRDIGVPEEYVSQAAGVLARGTSDGAGVYRSDGTYYAYSDMVGYIYANRELILAYCGLDGEQPAVTTAVTETAAATDTSGFPVTSAAASVSASLTTVTTTATTVSTTEETTQTTMSETTQISAPTEDAQADKPHSSWIIAAALGCIAAASAGFAGLFRILKKQESA